MGLGPMRQRQQRVASAGGARGSCGGAGLLALAWQATGALALRLAHGLAGLWLGRLAGACVRVSFFFFFFT